jgi:hypothetical protein
MIAQTQARVAAVEEIVKSIMKEGVHYGVIPGTGRKFKDHDGQWKTEAKPSLLKAGAEVICLAFGLEARIADIIRTPLENGHLEFSIKIELIHRESGLGWGSGVGLCSSLESKYRWRWVGSHGNKTKQPNPDIEDQYNTILKMAKKRALIDATLTALAASGLFTQDVEDFRGLDAPAAPKAVEISTRQRDVQADYRSLNAVLQSDLMLDYKTRIGKGLNGSLKTDAELDVLEELVGAALILQMNPPVEVPDFPLKASFDALKVTAMHKIMKAFAVEFGVECDWGTITMQHTAWLAAEITHYAGETNGK